MTASGRDQLSSVLRQARDALRPLVDRAAAAARALEVLERDLLPRTAGGDAYVVIGIVGPNNAGKSALFNALVGKHLSPSLPTGGATRRLVGAAHPDLLAKLRAEETLARFHWRSLDVAASGSANAGEALQPGDDPAEVLVSAEEDLPGSLMLIDTPDFDSILADNRIVSESLLAVADLVVAVVTRHSYQNREVVDFLRHWLQHGRPWMLVYNEGASQEVARSHAAKLAVDVGTPPLASYWAAHSLEVQQGDTPLDPRLLSRTGGPGAALRDHLRSVEKIGEVKRQAFTASLARLRDAMDETSSEIQAAAAEARAILAVADARAVEAGMRVASKAMPAAPFVEAFRTVLDRRSNRVSRSWRASLRRVRFGLEAIPALLRGRSSSREEQAAVTLAVVEKGELGAAWPIYWEELARDLGPEARHEARSGCTPVLAVLLDDDLAESRRDTARQSAEKALADQPPDIEAFRHSCETLVEEAVEERGFDIDIQLAADIATLMPLALAAVVIVNTAGIGSDIVAAGGGALSTFLIEKYTHLLGAGVLSRARRKWAELRGRQLADILTESTLPKGAKMLTTSQNRDAELASQLAEVSAVISGWQGPRDL